MEVISEGLFTYVFQRQETGKGKEDVEYHFRKWRSAPLKHFKKLN